MRPPHQHPDRAQNMLPYLMSCPGSANRSQSLGVAHPKAMGHSPAPEECSNAEHEPRQPPVRVQICCRCLADAEKTLKLGQQRRWVFELTLPNRKHRPSCLSQGVFLSAITHSIRSNFLSPEGASNLREACEAAAIVAMPEASMDKNGLPAARKDDVWCSSEAADVDSIAPAPTVQKLANSQFGSSVS